MAMRASNQQSVGSADWVSKEFAEISSLCENELEDFTFSARNEVEWLNEHMSDLFSSNRLHLADILKTPGKLRGKTPRTARQRSPQKEDRQPLGEISSADKRFNSPVRKTTPESPSILEAKEAAGPPVPQNLVAKPPDRGGRDSGYHGESQEEMEVELPETQDLERDERAASVEQLETIVMEEPAAAEPTRIDGGRSTDGSFHSAEENQRIKESGGRATTSGADGHHEAGDNDATDDLTVEDRLDDKVSEQLRRESANRETKAFVSVEEKQPEASEVNDAASEESTPAKPAVRKSSQKFASLPAREPLTTKKSMGNNRVSSQTSYLGRIADGKSFGGGLRPTDPGDDFDEDDTYDDRDGQTRVQKISLKDESETTGTSRALHNKSSTQRLTDRINALGKAPAPRQTKSIVAPAAQPTYPTLPEPQEPVQAEKKASGESHHHYKEIHEDSWMPDASDGSSSPNYQVYPSSDAEVEMEPAVAPVAQARTPSPAVEAKPVPTEVRVSTTPAGSPPKSVVEKHGSVQESKSRLQSLMQSARGLFGSSAVASAEAKRQASFHPSPKREEAPQPTYAPTREGQDDQTTASPQAVSKAVGDLSKTADEEYARDEPEVSPESDQTDQISDESQLRPGSAMGPPPRPRSALAKPGTLKRSVAKPTKEQPTQQKLSIKMPSSAAWRSLTASSAASKEQDHPASRTVASKDSTASLSPTASSNGSLKASVASKAKAALAAEKKREAEEKAAQKKADQRRELERKRAAQQEEAQKREQARQAAERRKERERQAAEEKKRQEQRQAVEKKRAEAQAKREQMQREQQAALKSSQYRPEPPRPVSRQAMVTEFPKPPTSHANANKQAAKRALNHEGDDNARPTQAPSNHSHQPDAKRRKTDEGDELSQAQPKRPITTGPVRISNIKSGLKSSIFGNNYPKAPPPAHHHAGGAQQTSAQAPNAYVANQIPPRPPTALDNARFQNGAIPFAGGNGHAPSAQPAAASGLFKTPMQPSRFGQSATQQQQHQQQLKSSPYINGDNIHLDDIDTDSEDEDSEAEQDRKANLPDWVRTPNLNETLMQQETINPDAVFGPIAPLNMEEMFKGRGQKKDFRSRTSSANWNGNDRLTDEEVRKDMEARERMRRDGGWTFGLS